MQHAQWRRRAACGRAAGVLAALAFLLSPMAPAAAATVLKRGLVGPVETLDPQKAATASETALALDLFEGLVRRDGAGRIVPGAATAWTVSADGLEWRFTLDKGGRWSNGDAVKATDFVASFRRLFDPATEATEDGPLQVIANAGAIKAGFAKPETLGVVAEEDGTLTIRLDRATPTFLDRLAAPAALPVNVAAAKKAGTDYRSGAKLVSNGAYSLGTSGAKTGYVLARNARRADAASVAIDSVVYRPFETAADCVAAFRATEVQVCPDVPTDALADLRQEFGADLHVARFAGTYFYVVNTKKKPLDDARIRRALSLAVDRAALAKQAWSGGMLAAATLVPPGLSALPESTEASLEERRRQARTLLADAGYGPGKPPLKLAIRLGSGQAHEQAAELVIADWKAIGVEAELVTGSGNAHFAELRDGASFDLARAGWIADEPDALDMLAILKGGGRFNYAGYANPAFDSLVETASGDMDADSRRDAIARAEALVAEDMPVIPLLSYAALALVAPVVTGWEDNLVDQHPSRTLGLAE